MEFGYFTLSDNRYPDNPRTPEQFVTQIYEQALWAERLGLHSVWVGEHHFNLLGVNACPNILLAQIAGATSRIRLAPAVARLDRARPLVAQGPVLPVRGCRDPAAPGAAAAQALCRLLLAPEHGARGE